jgi:hypothetical protein
VTAENPENRAGQAGHPAVDEVLAGLDDLDSRPVSEHVAVFESAHDRLRGALADAGCAGATASDA